VAGVPDYGNDFINKVQAAYGTNIYPKGKTDHVPRGTERETTHETGV
jgi:hypothetical protein